MFFPLGRGSDAVSQADLFRRIQGDQEGNQPEEQGAFDHTLSMRKIVDERTVRIHVTQYPTDWGRLLSAPAGRPEQSVIAGWAQRRFDRAASGWAGPS